MTGVEEWIISIKVKKGELKSACIKRMKLQRELEKIGCEISYLRGGIHKRVLALEREVQK